MELIFHKTRLVQLFFAPTKPAMETSPEHLMELAFNKYISKNTRHRKSLDTPRNEISFSPIKNLKPATLVFDFASKVFQAPLATIINLASVK
jgi:hypothetical protein